MFDSRILAETDEVLQPDEHFNLSTGGCNAAVLGFCVILSYYSFSFYGEFIQVKSHYMNQLRRQAFFDLKNQEVYCTVIGAVWTRIMNDYGHVDDDTPSFAISLYKEYRGQGIGTQLMEKMLELLRLQGYRKASLTVQKENYAVRLYEKVDLRLQMRMTKNILWCVNYEYDFD